MQKTNVWLLRGKAGEGQIDSLGLIHTTMYETENQSDPVVQHRELYSVLCSDLYRKRALKRVHICVQVSSVQSLSCVRLFVTPWTAARQDSPSVTNSWSLLKLMSIESVMPPNHLILCQPLLLPPSIFPSIRVISNDSVLHIRWPQYQSFSFNISPSNEYSRLISFRMDWLDFLAVQGSLKSLLQHHSTKASILQRSAFFSNSHIHT